MWTGCFVLHLPFICITWCSINPYAMSQCWREWFLIKSIDVHDFRWPFSTVFNICIEIKCDDAFAMQISTRTKEKTKCWKTIEKILRDERVYTQSAYITSVVMNVLHTPYYSDCWLFGCSYHHLRRRCCCFLEFFLSLWCTFILYAKYAVIHIKSQPKEHRQTNNEKNRK